MENYLSEMYRMQTEMEDISAAENGMPAGKSVAIDLFGLIEYRGTIIKRQMDKRWGVIFACTVLLLLLSTWTLQNHTPQTAS